MTMNRLHCVGQNKWLQSLAYDSQVQMDRAIPGQNQNKFLCAVFLDSRPVRVRLVHAMWHLAMYKFVTHSMAHFRVEIQTANDDAQLNKIRATATDKSVNKTNNVFLMSSVNNHYFYGQSITFSLSICFVGGCFSSTIIDSMPAILFVYFLWQKNLFQIVYENSLHWYSFNKYKIQNAPRLMMHYRNNITKLHSNQAPAVNYHVHVQLFDGVGHMC